MDSLGVDDVPIGEYGLIGDTRTAALVSPGGAIDWLCVPRFDGEPLFGALVGGPDAGAFVMGPAEPAELADRRYRPDSAVLETTWTTGRGRMRLTEGFVADPDGLRPRTLLVRRVDVQGAACRVRVSFRPRFGWRRSPPRIERRAGQWVCSWPSTAVAVVSSPTDALVPDQDTEHTLEAGQVLCAVMSVAHREPAVLTAPDTAWAALEETDRWWRSWSAQIGDLGPAHDTALRSLITLKLLTYSPSGAPVAAPTTSLPELVGGQRNWDYRYAWPRDASIGIAAFLGAAKEEEARSFSYWILHASRLDRPRLPPLLSVDGRPAPDEVELADWPGYAGSRPVRTGNGAHDQHQLDVYGWVLDAAWLLVRAGHALYGETWRILAGFADLVAGRWREPDAGIWEVRGEPRHYVHSKLMAFLALDRASRIAERHHVRVRRRERWAAERDAVAAEVWARGFDQHRSSFVWAYDRRDLDAALLVLPLLDFEEPDAPAVVGTVDAVRRELGAGGPLFYRYPPGSDGLEGGEGAFLPCSFWMAQALVRTGRVDEGAEVFAAAGRYGGRLGLFSEEVDPATGSALGNFPQALTHAAAVQAALALRDATRGSAADRGRRRTPGARQP